MSRLVRRLFTRILDPRRPARVSRSAADLRAHLLLQPLETRAVPATFTVTNTNDTTDTASPLFAGSLRAAITAANATAGADVVSFSPGTFGTFQAIFLNSGQQLSVTDSVTITGPGRNNLIVSGNNGTRVFNINVANVVGVVTISGMEITGGRIDPEPGISSVTNGDGAAINIANENVTLDGVIVSNSFLNAAQGDSGGGIGGAAGALLTVRNSTISGNTTNGRGGGLYMTGGGALLMENTLVTGNTAIATTEGGGGLYFNGAVATTGALTGATIRNSTITGNRATIGSGGGVALRAFAGTLLVQNSTISGNTAGETATTSGLGGGGIALSTITGTPGVTLQSTIVSGNSSAGNNTYSDISTAGMPLVTVTSTNSAIGDADGFLLSAISAFNLPTGSALNLQTLALNGGQSQTVLLGAGSAAIDRGSNPASLTTDQRGTGFARGSGLTDIGAAESGNNNVPIAWLASAPTVTSNGATTYTFTVLYDDAAGVRVSTLDGNDVRVTGPASFNVLASFVSVDTTTDGRPRTATYRITPPGGSWDPADLGTYAILMQASQVTNTAGTPAAVAASTLGTFVAATPITLTVTSTADTTAAGTLRTAITSANARTLSPDTIVFDSTFGGSNPARTITLTSQLSITDPVTITGPGATLLTVTGNNASRVFSISEATFTQIPVTLSGMRITGGNVAGGNRGGGVFFNNEALTLDSVVVTGNVVGGTGVNDAGGGVGGIANARLTVLNSTVSGNTSGGRGAGLYIGGNSTLVIDGTTISGNSITGTGATNDGAGAAANAGSTVTVRNSTISGNTTAGGHAGGLYVNAGSLLMEGSTISGNRTVNGNGGGILLNGTTIGTGVTIRNSTIANNSSTGTGSGGGIGLLAFNGSLTIQNSTIAKNQADSTGTALGNGGGGIALVSVGGGNTTISLASAIVADNVSGNGFTDISSVGTRTTTSAVNSAVGVNNGFTLNTNTNNLFGASLQLQTLGNNGGPTQTMALGSTSAALDKGSNPANLTTDQRGTGFARVSGAAADIGAFEFQGTSGVAPTVVGAPRINNGVAQRSMVTTMSVTFSTVVTFAGPVASAFTLTRIGGGAVTIGTATATTVSGATVVTLTGFSGTEASSGGSLNDGRYTLTALANQITANGQQLNGGTNFVYGDSGAATGNQLYRFFGDVTGDRFCNGADFATFRTAFGTQSPDPNYIAAFDANADGFVNGADFAPFRTNFGGSI